MDPVVFARLTEEEQDAVITRMSDDQLLRLYSRLAAYGPQLSGDELGSWLSRAIRKVGEAIKDKGLLSQIPFVGPLISNFFKGKSDSGNSTSDEQRMLMMQAMLQQQQAQQQRARRGGLRPRTLAMIGIGVGGAALLAMLLMRRR